MASYLVTLPSSCTAKLLNGRNAMVVTAEDAADAKAIAKSFDTQDSDAKWASATVTALSAGDEEDLTFYVSITPTGEDELEFETAADFASLQLLATAMKALLDADDVLGGETTTVAAGPPVTLTIPAAAGLGAAVITAEARLNGVAIPSVIASVTAVDVAATDRVITFCNPATSVLPRLESAVTI